MSNQDNTDTIFSLTYTELNNLLVQAVKHGINSPNALDTSTMTHHKAVYSYTEQIIKKLLSDKSIAIRKEPKFLNSETMYRKG